MPEPLEAHDRVWNGSRKETLLPCASLTLGLRPLLGKCLCVTVAACRAVQEWSFKHTSNSGSPLIENLIWLLKTPQVFSMKPIQIDVMPWYKLLLSWVEMSSEVWPWALTWAAQFASPWWHFHADLGTAQEKMFLWSVGAGCFYSPDSRAIRPRENGCSSHGGLQVCSWESSSWSTERYRTQIQPQM